ncbi:MAG: ABC transporter ATP-binding protein [Alcaligenaceae bacterium]
MLVLEDVHAFYGPSHVLHGVSMTLQAGTIGAVLGRNGVGKSTTVKAIMGLVPVSQGQVKLGVQDITRMSPHLVARAGVGYVPEGRMLFPDLTVLENIQVAQRVVAKRWTTAALFTLFPRLQERIHHKGSQLSGGEQQMVAIARALASDPELLLLDEPSQGLAPKIVRELVDVFIQLKNEGVSLLLIEQNLNLAERIADQMFVMAKGQIVYDAPIAKFRTEIESVKSQYLTL